MSRYISHSLLRRINPRIPFHGTSSLPHLQAIHHKSTPFHLPRSTSTIPTIPKTPQALPGSIPLLRRASFHTQPLTRSLLRPRPHRLDPTPTARSLRAFKRLHTDALIEDPTYIIIFLPLPFVLAGGLYALYIYHFDPPEFVRTCRRINDGVAQIKSGAMARREETTSWWKTRHERRAERQRAREATREAEEAELHEARRIMGKKVWEARKQRRGSN